MKRTYCLPAHNRNAAFVRCEVNDCIACASSPMSRYFRPISAGSGIFAHEWIEMECFDARDPWPYTSNPSIIASRRHTSINVHGTITTVVQPPGTTEPTAFAHINAINVLPRPISNAMIVRPSFKHPMIASF